MFAALLTIATLHGLPAGTLPDQPSAIELTFQAAPPQYQVRASRDATIAPWLAGGRVDLQPNAGAHAAKPAARSDYDQEPESISGGTEP